eukprot:jgi/Ulvmu1/9322/UM050_0071.1
MFGASMSLAAFVLVSLTDAAVAKLFNVYLQPGVQLQRDKARELRSSSALPLDGSVDVGYFYTEIQLGTPPQTFSVIPDTGSALTYVPCRGCDSCGKHADAPFDFTASSTFHRVGCDESACRLGCKSSCCALDKQCRYTISYTEGSSVNGHLVQDYIWMPPVQYADYSAAGHTNLSASMDSVPVTFGCDNFESGELYRQTADGITGLADDPLSITKQLAGAGAIAPEFTICFGHDGGGIILGGLPEPLLGQLPPAIAATRSRAAPYYNVNVEGLRFGDELLNIDLSALEQGYGTIVDSGTTFTYLPSQAHAAFTGAFADAAADQEYSLRWDAVGTHCFSSLHLTSHEHLAAAFPNITLLFSEGATLALTPKSYLFQKSSISADAAPATWCLGFLDGGPEGATIGAITIRDVAVTFDNGQRELRFRPVPSCREFTEAYADMTSLQTTPAGQQRDAPNPPAEALKDSEAGTEADAVHAAGSLSPTSAVAQGAPPPDERHHGPAQPPTSVATESTGGSTASIEMPSATGPDSAPDNGSRGDDSLLAGVGESIRRHLRAIRLALGLLLAAIVGVLLCIWHRRRPRAKGYTELVESRGRVVARSGASDLESQSPGHRAKADKARAPQKTVMWK